MCLVGVEGSQGSGFRVTEVAAIKKRRAEAQISVQCSQNHKSCDNKGLWFGVWREVTKMLLPNMGLGFTLGAPFTAGSLRSFSSYSFCCDAKTHSAKTLTLKPKTPSRKPLGVP